MSGFEQIVMLVQGDLGEFALCNDFAEHRDAADLIFDITPRHQFQVHELNFSVGADVGISSLKKVSPSRQRACACFQRSGWFGMTS